MNLFLALLITLGSFFSYHTSMANILDYNNALNAYNKNKSAISYNNVLNTINKIQSQGGSTVGASTGPSGAAPAAPAAPSGGGGGIDPAAAAEAALEAQINAAKQQAQDMRTTGQSTFNTILDSINKYRTQNTTDYNNANTDIGNNADTIAHGDAVSGAQGAADINRRAGVLGLSSAINLGNQFENARAADAGSVRATETSNKNANQSNFNKNEDTATTNQQQAQNSLDDINRQANSVENQGYGAGLSTFQNALNNIVNYQRQLSAITPGTPGAYTPDFSGVSNTVNGILGGLGNTGADQPLTDVNTANPVNPTDITTLLKQHGLLS